MIRLLGLFSLLAITLYLSGCATYGQDVRKGLNLAQQGQYKLAATSLEKTIDPKGDDRLLYYTELGVIYHLAGDYEKSNRLLETAERIAESLYTKKVSNILVTAMSNPRQGTYQATDFERVFINYYKALNYFLLAAQSQNRSEKKQALEGARVESRRLDMILASIEHGKGNYKEQADKEKSMFSKLLRIFHKLSGEIIDKNKIVYRNDAFAHYLAGIIYEQHNEFDDARVAYQKAASLYEDGYQKQYALDKNITMQAWFDTIRMMQKSGGWGDEISQLSRTKLDKKKRTELKNYAKLGHVIVIEHTGMVPERDEMNMILTADARTHQIVMSPILTGNRQRQLDQRFWFFALYADKGISDVLSAAYEKRMVPALMQFGMVKREYLGPLWGAAERLGLINVLQGGMRITVPYYRVLSHEANGPSTLMVDGQSQPLVLAQSVAHMAVQQQLLAASGDLQEAMARAAFKNLTVAKAASVGGDAGAILGLIGKIAANATSAAETRNWLLLPGQIKISRMALPAGAHQLKLVSQVSNQNTVSNSKQVNIEKGKMAVWKVRTFANKQRPSTQEADTKKLIINKEI